MKPSKRSGGFVRDVAAAARPQPRRRALPWDRIGPAVSLSLLAFTKHEPWQLKVVFGALLALALVASLLEMWTKTLAGKSRIAAIGDMEPSVFKSFLTIMLARPTGIVPTSESIKLNKR